MVSSLACHLTASGQLAACGRQCAASGQLATSGHCGLHLASSVPRCAVSDHLTAPGQVAASGQPLHRQRNLVIDIVSMRLDNSVLHSMLTVMRASLRA